MPTPSPSPFARSLLFGYVGMFLYELDAPLAERRAAALSLDSTLLAELLGSEAIRELLDPEVLAEVEGAAAAHSTRSATSATPRARPTCCASSATSPPTRPAPAACSRAVAHRAGVRAPGDPGADGRRGALARDRGRRPGPRRARRGAAGRGAGGVHRAGGRPAGRPRRSATPAPTGRSPRRVRGAVRARRRRRGGRARPAGVSGRLVRGELRPAGALPLPACRPTAARSSTATPRCCAGCGGRRWPGCAPRSSPSSQRALGRFLPAWQGAIGADDGRRGRMRRAPGAEDVLGVVEQLAGAPLPASALESLVLPGAAARLLPRAARRAHRAGRGHVDRVRPAGRQRRVAGRRAHRRRRPAAARTRADDVTPTRRCTARCATDARRAAGRCSSASSPTHAGRRWSRPARRDGAARRRALVAALWDLVWAGSRSPTTRSPAAGAAVRRRVTRQRALARRGAQQRRAPYAQLRRAARPRAMPIARPARRRPGRWSGAPVARAGADPAGPRARRGVPGAARRAHPRRARHRARHRRVRRHLPGAAGDGGVGPCAARLRRRGAGRGAVRGARRDRPAAGRVAPRGRRQRAVAPSSSPPPTPPSRGARRWSGRPRRGTTPTVPDARRVPSSCSRTGSRRSTSSAAASRC